MINDIVTKAIEEEVKLQTRQATSKYEQIKNKYNKTLDEVERLKVKNEELEMQLNKGDLLNSISANISIENIEEVIISNLNFKYEHIAFDGMDSEGIPEWFKILCRYFDNKEDVLNVFDLFNIEYPNWAKNIVLPNQYDRTTLELCLSRVDKLYVTNGQIYDGNMGFYYQQFKAKKFNVAEVFNSNSYVSIPYQLLLKNKLLIEDCELFNVILQNLYNNRSHAEYFLKVVEYQDVPLEKVKLLLAPNKHGKITYKSVLKKYPQLLKDDKIGDKFKSQISEYFGSELYILKFTKEIQKEYFLKRKAKRSNYDTYDFVKLIDSSDELVIEEKAELIKQCYLNLSE